MAAPPSSDDNASSADHVSSAADTPAESSVREFIDTVRIARAKRDLYAFWRDFSNLPQFMEKVRKVREVDSLSSIWTVADGAGPGLDWEFIVTDDEADRLIAWSASGNTPVKYSGRVEFKEAQPSPGTRSDAATDVTATLRYEAPAGVIDSLVARMSGLADAADDPAVQTRSDLLRFKQIMERAPAVTSAPPDPTG